jgi:hypothetical protein
MPLDAASDFDSFFATAPISAPTYFAHDCLTIVARAQESADALPGIAALVLCSIRQPFFLLRLQMTQVGKLGTKAPCLFGWKRAGLQYVVDNRASLHDAARRAYGRPAELDNLILRYLDVPGLGIVKASLFAQMTVGAGACIDSHNLERLGIHHAAFRTPKTLQEKSLRKRVSQYNATWSANGSSAYWWDSWCDHIAITYAKYFADGAAVSAIHRLAITTEVPLS